jgi:hypothetical protein
MTEKVILCGSEIDFSAKGKSIIQCAWSDIALWDVIDPKKGDR